jgi:uncharacterized protein YrrD
MRRANHIIGLPVITAADSREVATIRDLAYSTARDSVVGFLLDGADRDALLFGSVQEITADTVVVQDESVLIDHDDAPDIKRAVDSSASINDMDVMDRAGDLIGTIEDTFVDPSTGRVIGFQIHVEELPDTVRNSYLRRPSEQPDLAPGRGDLSRDTDADPGHIGVDRDYLADEEGHGEHLDDSEVKFFLPIGRVTAWEEEGVRVDYDRGQAEMYRERYPRGYLASADNPGRRAA